jgi:hypothetical protein
MFTHKLLVTPEPPRISSRLVSMPLTKPTDISLPISGPRLSPLHHPSPFGPRNSKFTAKSPSSEKEVTDVDVEIAVEAVVDVVAVKVVAVAVVTVVTVHPVKVATVLPVKVVLAVAEEKLVPPVAEENDHRVID